MMRGGATLDIGNSTAFAGLILVTKVTGPNIQAIVACIIYNVAM